MKARQNRPLGTNHIHAGIAGGLFIIGTVSGVLCFATSGQLWHVPDYLLQLATHETLARIGAMLQFCMGLSCAGISIALYPLLKSYSPGLALGAVGFRLVENVLQIMKAVSMLALLALSQAWLQAGPVEATYFQGLGQILTQTSDWMNHGAALVCFSIGAALYYILFYQHRLIPSWLSVWGLVSVALTAIASVLVMLGVIPALGTVQGIANLSILPQEMVLAVWLIVKGIQPSPRTFASESVSVQPALS
jgi:hypothetical protein